MAIGETQRVKEKIHPPSESTASFIRDILIKNDKDYPYRMWRAWCLHLESRSMKPPKYESFRKYVYTLVRANLIRHTTAPTEARVEFPNLKPLPPSYYEIVPKNIDDYEKWRNPQVVVWGEKMRLGKRRYRRRQLGLPQLSRGRPRKVKKAKLPSRSR
jgi:hypothetical protein